jgi:predicted permease
MSWWQDARVGCRLLRHSPGFALVTILTLGLALGANTTVFSVVHQVLLASLPVEQPERLAVLTRSNAAEGGITRFSQLFFRRLEAERDVVAGVLCRAGGLERVTVGTDAGGEPALGELVSGSFFEVLGVRPHVGRLISVRDDVVPGGHPVVVLSYRYWQRQFASDPSVVGRTIRVTGVPMTVIGVSARGFDGLDPGQPVDLRVPLAMVAEVRAGSRTVDRRGPAEMNIIVRLGDASAQQAAAALTARFRQFLADTAPPSSGDRASRDSERIDLAPAARGFGSTRRQYEMSLQVLMVITSVLLVVACLNIANLLMARASSRAREFAIRRAVGAGSGRLVRQLLIESVMLSSCGVVLGALLAFPGSKLLIRLMMSTGTASYLTIEANSSIVVFHFATALLLVAIFALAPALMTRRSNLTHHLRDASRGTSGIGGRRVLLAAQIALSMVVLVGATLFVRTVHALRSTDPGFRTDGLLMLALSPKNAGHADDRVLPFFQAFRERVSALPGVSAVTYSQVRPLMNVTWRTAVVTSSCCLPDDARPYRNVVGPHYFGTMGIPVVAGRDFNDGDTAKAPKVAIVNESFARLLGAARDAIGTRIGVTSAEHTIVGVVKDAKYSHIREAAPATWYVPYEQYAATKYLDMFVRTSGDPEVSRESVRAAIASVDRSVALFEVRTLDAHIDNLLVVERTIASLATLFGLSGAALAALGVYGILAFHLGQRRREIGIRTALGARPSTIIGMVAGDISPVIVGGVVIGAVAASALARSAATLLYGVAPLDAVSVATATGLMTLLAAGAAAIPARRASRLDPVQALSES